MAKSLIHGLNQVDMQAVVNEYNLSSFFFPTLFPLRYTPNLSWEQLQGDKGAPVAGDVISYDSRAPRKRRETVSKLSGKIPKIGVAREKDETEMNEYQMLRRLATDEAKKRLVEWIWEDPEFCYTAVNARLEHLALRAASTAKAVLSTSNNDGIVTEHSIDFLVPDANKSGVTVPIIPANAATSKPITKIKAIVKAAKAKGRILTHIFTDADTADAILMAAETLSVVAPWVMQATQLTQTPTLASLNAALGGMSLPKIYIIESFVDIEIRGTRTTVNPWEPGVMTFSSSPVLGTTHFSDLADEFVEPTAAIKVKRGHVLIKRYAVEEPTIEVCLATANAMPVLGSPDDKYFVDTLNATWTH